MQLAEAVGQQSWMGFALRFQPSMFDGLRYWDSSCEKMDAEQDKLFDDVFWWFGVLETSMIYIKFAMWILFCTHFGACGKCRHGTLMRSYKMREDRRSLWRCELRSFWVNKKASAIFRLILKTLLQDEYPTSWYLHLYCDRGQGPENTEFLPFFGD